DRRPNRTRLGTTTTPRRCHRRDPVLTCPSSEPLWGCGEAGVATNETALELVERREPVHRPDRRFVKARIDLVLLLVQTRYVRIGARDVGPQLDEGGGVGD